MSKRNQRLFGIKREKIPENLKGGKICKDCKKGLLITFYHYQLDAMVTKCQGCPLYRIDPKKKLYPHFVTANGNEVSNE